SSNEAGSVFALAFLDMSTGEFRVTECDQVSLGAEIARLEPGEVIVSDALYGDAELAPCWRSLPAVMPLARDVFDGATARGGSARFFAGPAARAFGALLSPEAARGRGWLALRRAHAAGAQAAALAAEPRSRRRDVAHRCRDPRQSRTGAHAVRRAPR